MWLINYLWLDLWKEFMQLKEAKHVKFYLRKTGSKTAKIRATLPFHYTHAEIVTGLEVDINKWDPKTKRTKPNTKHAYQDQIITGKEFDQFLDQIAGSLALAYNECLKQNYGKFPDRHSVVEKYRMMDIGQLNMSTIALPFTTYFDDFIADGTKGNLHRENSDNPSPWKPATIKKHKIAKWHWENFDNLFPLSEFSTSKLSEFIQYLVKEKKANTTIEKVYKSVKLYVKWLVYNGKLPQKTLQELRDFKIGLRRISDKQVQQQNNLALTEDELNSIIRASIPESKQYLQRTRDVFVFQCHTGVRFSDLTELKKNNIKLNRGQHGSVEIFSAKGQKRLVIPLTKTARNIIDKYHDLEGENLLPCPSNQKINIYIKELFKLAKINDHVELVSFVGSSQQIKSGPKHKFASTHVARKTFINLALNKGMKPEIVAAIAGCSLPVIMKHYRAVKEADMFAAMKEFE